MRRVGLEIREINAKIMYLGLVCDDCPPGGGRRNSLPSHYLFVVLRNARKNVVKFLKQGNIFIWWSIHASNNDIFPCKDSILGA